MYRKIISDHEFHSGIRNKLIWANILKEGTPEDRAIRHEICREIEQNKLHFEETGE